MYTGWLRVIKKNGIKYIRIYTVSKVFFYEIRGASVILKNPMLFFPYQDNFQKFWFLIFFFWTSSNNSFQALYMWNCYEELQLLIYLSLALIGAKQYKKRFNKIFWKFDKTITI
jgi:hypothetical protein